MIPGALRRNISSYDKGTLKKTTTVDKTTVTYQQTSKDKSRHGTPTEWQALQNKIFTRWVNQKLAKRRVKIDDVTTGLKDGSNLVILLEALSDTPFDKKLETTTMRVKQIDNVNRALEFMFKVGVQMPLKPSAENVVDGNEKIILGMLWSVMLKFLKIGEEEELNAQDALLMWMQNQVNDYKGVSVTNLTTSFHDGLALCALIHHFRPKLINMDALDAKDSEQNLQTAFDAAETYFGLEQYLKPSDIAKLDDKSMSVFLAEFYYGISEERRLDIAAKRVVKVIRFTDKNDKFKEEYTAKAQQLNKQLEDLQPQLAKMAEIDNTMAGAKKRLDELTAYKTKYKGELLSAFLYLESLYNQIARRLHEAKRPEFNPSPSVKDLQTSLDSIEEKEGKLQVSLHEEFNRQIRLANTNQRHIQKFDELKKWAGEKKVYLSTKEVVKSVGAATYQLNVLADFQNEFKGVQVVFEELKKMGDGLATEKFEDEKSVRSRESQLHTTFEELTTLATSKKEILDDDLAREKVAEKVTGWDRDHVRKYEKLEAFITEKKKYLETKAEINSVSDAKLQLELLSAYESEKKLIAEGNVPPLQKLGSEIRSEKYETKHSIWVLPELSKVHKRDMQIEADFQQLDLLSSEKLKILTDDLQREEFREKLNRLNQEHIDKYGILDKWIKEKNAYLNVVEEIKSSADAEIHLGILVAYHKERQDTYQASVPPLKTLGVQIITSEYKSAISKYKFKTPGEVTDREEMVEKAFAELDTLHAVKHKRLIDDLKREEFREKVELWNQKHVDKSAKIQAFIAASTRYLKKKETVDSIADAHLNLSRLRQYSDDQKDNDIKFNDLQKLGTEIRDAKYKSDLSDYKFPHPETVTERETAIATSFKELSELASKKKAVLEDDLAREEFREKLRQWNVSHIDKNKKIQEFIVASKVYLGKKEPVSSIADAQLNLARLNEYFDEKKIADVKYDTLQTLGAQIKDDEYKTELSTFKFKTPEEIDAREASVKKEFGALDELSKKKLAVLEDDLGREEFREKLRQMNLKHTDKASKLHEFILATKTYLHTRDEVASIPQAHLNLSRFREYTDEKKINDIKFGDLREFGAEIKAAEYKKLTVYKYPHPDEIDRREGEIADDFKEIEKLANQKFDVLNDDLERELFKEKLRRWNQDHIDKHNTVQTFISQSRKYLKTKEGVSSISEAQVNLDRIRTYFGEKADFDIKESGLRALGRQIKQAEYKTELSQYKFTNVKEIEFRENDISIAFAELDLLSGEKDVEGDQMDWLRGQAEKLNLILGEVDEGEDDDEEEGDGASTLEVKERAARRKSVKVAAALMSKGEYKAGGKLAVLKDDLAREQFKQKLRRWNKQHIDSAKGLLLWIAENRAYLEKKEPVDSISDAEKNLARLRAYETAKADVLAVQFAALRKLGGELLGAEYKTQWSQWKWETPAEVTQREEELDALFKILDKISATKFGILDDDLHREEFREKLRLAGQSHLEAFNNIKAWAVTMRERLEKKETVNSISDANNNLASFAAALADKEDATNINVSSLKKAGAEILSAEYKGLSTYKFPDPGSIKGREFTIDKEWHLLEQLATEKKLVLDTDLKREILKEELRLSFANAARDFNRFALDAIQEAKEAHFGFSLLEVKQAKDALNKQDESHRGRAGTNKKEYEKFHAELTKLGVVENVYTKHTPATLNQTQDDLAGALKTRQEAHAKELQRQTDNDALCLDFAHKAEALNKKLKAKKEAIATSTKAIEEQLRDVETSEEEQKKSDEKEQAETAQGKVTAAGVTNNPHTILSIADLEVGLKQYSLFLGTKKDVLSKDVEHKKLRGVTAAEYAEIDRQFKKYDADQNGRLERSEFKACLYSLGEELGKRQIQAILDQYTKKENAESILYDQFKEFMITYFGVTDTKQDILGALKEIAAGDEKAVSIVHIRPRRMQVFTEDDLGFFQKHCTKTEGRAESWDYIPFVESVFAR